MIFFHEYLFVTNIAFIFIYVKNLWDLYLKIKKKAESFLKVSRSYRLLSFLSGEKGDRPVGLSEED